MQHHQHGTRAATAIAAAPHLRAPHHLAAMHANAAAVASLNAPPQSHMASAAAAQTTATGATHNATAPQQQQHMRAQHARLQQQQGQHISQNLHSTTPLHKLRQQHQHLSNNNTSQTTGTLNKLKHQPPQPHYQQQHPHINYSHINATQQHMGVAAQQQQQPTPPPQQQQQHRNVPYHNQPPHHKTVMPSLPLQPMPPPLPSQKIAGAHKHGLPIANAAVSHQYYANNHASHNNKNKYTNNNYQNNNNCNNVNGTASYGTSTPVAPKQILQNPNRVLKPRQQATAPTTPTLTPTHTAHAAATTTTNIVTTNIDSTNGTEDDSSSGTQKTPPTPVVSVLQATALSSDNKENESNAESFCDSNIQSDHNSEQSSTNSNCSNGNMNQSTQSAVQSNTNTSCNNILSNEDLSIPKNSKEKTPMCLVNELARYNKITHQYRLTNEKGPAHCKRFTVTLKLGDEEYSAEGYKIKKAQHLAAADAIEKTKYKHPVPKANRRNEEGGSSRTNITPTVELNALAMKLGQQTYYLFDPRQMPPNDHLHTIVDGMPAFVPAPHGHIMPTSGPPPPPPPPAIEATAMRRNGNYHLQANGMVVPPPLTSLGAHHHTTHRYAHAHPRGMYAPKYPQRYPLVNGMLTNVPPPAAAHYAVPSTPCRITLIVGKQKFIGIGRTLQQAKHDAAARALQVLKTQSTEQQNNDNLDASLQENDSKSPISMVHEIGIRRNMNVHFKVLREEGPAHMKNFITACVVGTIITEGEGNGKKISKKRAAEKMLEELKKLPPLTPTKSPVKRIKVKTPGKMGAVAGSGGKGGGRKRSNANASMKEKHDDDIINEEDNPITKLIQLQQNRKEKEPIFELISKNGSDKSRRREFIIEVTAHGMVARGIGQSKKLAKRNAAENLLMAMGLLESHVETAHDGGPTCTTAASNTNTTNTTTQITATSNQTTNAEATVANKTDPASAPVLAADLITNLTNTAKEIEVPLITTSAGQVPGILILRQNKKHATKKKDATQKTHDDKPAKTELPNTEQADANAVAPHIAPDTTTSSSSGAVVDLSINTASTGGSNNVASAADKNSKPAAVAVNNNVSSTSSTIANTARDTDKGTPATSTTSTTSNTTKSSGGVHMKDQLLYLAKLLGFEVNFSDYPKGNHSEFLTIVTLSSDPPQICHGVGANSEESQNDAAKNALKILSELGLNCAK